MLCLSVSKSYQCQPRLYYLGSVVPESCPSRGLVNRGMDNRLINVFGAGSVSIKMQNDTRSYRFFQHAVVGRDASKG